MRDAGPSARRGHRGPRPARADLAGASLLQPVDEPLAEDLGLALLAGPAGAVEHRQGQAGRGAGRRGPRPAELAVVVVDQLHAVAGRLLVAGSRACRRRTSSRRSSAGRWRCTGRSSAASSWPRLQHRRDVARPRLRDQRQVVHVGDAGLVQGDDLVLLGRALVSRRAFPASGRGDLRRCSPGAVASWVGLPAQTRPQ